MCIFFLFIFFLCVDVCMYVSMYFLVCNFHFWFVVCVLDLMIFPLS